ncbi:MAG: SNF2-related protein [Pirellulales bacterium]
MTTTYHAKYFAHELPRQSQAGGIDLLSMALFDSCFDLNPNQIEAAMFALRRPLSKGVLLADEVGLGKTIQAGLVVCQYWAERQRRRFIICPANLRRQWALDDWFKRQRYNKQDQVYDSIYVNGDNNLENLGRRDQTKKVRLIEEEFGCLKSDVEGN